MRLVGKRRGITTRKLRPNADERGRRCDLRNPNEERDEREVYEQMQERYNGGGGTSVGREARMGGKDRDGRSVHRAERNSQLLDQRVAVQVLQWTELTMVTQKEGALRVGDLERRWGAGRLCRLLLLLEHPRRFTPQTTVVAEKKTRSRRQQSYPNQRSSDEWQINSLLHLSCYGRRSDRKQA
jgi:hypothetical protein